jgi:hypothetical protein
VTLGFPETGVWSPEKWKQSQNLDVSLTKKESIYLLNFCAVSFFQEFILPFSMDRQ